MERGYGESGTGSIGSRDSIDRSASALLCALGVVFVGLPLYWLRLKLERKLIEMARSARAVREGRKIASTVGIAQSTAALSSL